MEGSQVLHFQAEDRGESVECIISDPLQKKLQLQMELLINFTRCLRLNLSILETEKRLRSVVRGLRKERLMQ